MGVVITIVVYGAVALIVKADDVGLAMCGNDSRSLLGSLSRGVGHGLVVGMPYFLKVLAAVGTAAMLWVGGSIIMHGLAEFGWHWPEETVHHLSVAAAGALPGMAGAAGWITTAFGAAVIGIVVGSCLIPLVQFVIAPAFNAISNLRRGDAS